MFTIHKTISEFYYSEIAIVILDTLLPFPPLPGKCNFHHIITLNYIFSKQSFSPHF